MVFLATVLLDFAQGLKLDQVLVDFIVRLLWSSLILIELILDDMELLNLLKRRINGATRLDFLVLKLLKEVCFSEGRLEIFDAHRLKGFLSSLISRYLSGSIYRFLTYSGDFFLFLLTILLQTGLRQLILSLHHALLMIL